MSATRQPSHPSRAGVVWLVGFASAAAVTLGATRMFGDEHAGLIAGACFAAVISAAMLISWGAEAAQFFISQGFAVALIALLQVLPEFMVEAVIAWKGEIANMFANATGSNRLLIGLGWPLIFFTADISHRLRTGRGVDAVRLRRENVIELCSLALASSFYLKLLVFGSLTVFDGVFLCLLYVLYLWVLSRLPEEQDESKEDLLAPARVLVEIRSPLTMRLVVFGIFILGGGVMALVSEPFVESLKHVAGAWNIPAFFFIQWVAPFLSEFPEKVTAFYWSRTVRLAPMAMLNMISSTVSQFTLLVGMIPLVYLASYSFGHLGTVTVGLFGLPIVPMLDAHLRTEVLLSWAMTLLGCAQLAKLRFSRGNACLLLGLWLVQFLAGPIRAVTGVPEMWQHLTLAGLCVVLAVVELTRRWSEIDLRAALRETFALMRGAES
jgi:cation:H+ antiporter